MHAFVKDDDGIDVCTRCARARVAVEQWGIFECKGPQMGGINREPLPYWRVTAGNPETRMAIGRARQVTTQAGISVQCECPECVMKREAVLSPGSVSKIWGTVFGEPVDEPIAPPPINWLTHQSPLTDTVAERAAFLKKEGLACPTEITPDDIEAINHGKMW